jgi:hypothetical protein
MIGWKRRGKKGKNMMMKVEMEMNNNEPHFSRMLSRKW